MQNGQSSLLNFYLLTPLFFIKKLYPTLILMHYKTASILFLSFSIVLFSCHETKTNKISNASPADSNYPTVDTVIVKTPPAAAPAAIDDDPVKFTGALKTSTAEYIDLDANGDNELLIVKNNQDTTYYIVQTQQSPSLTRGDRIRIEWKNGTYRPAGDPEFPVKATFALSYQLVKPGMLSVAKKKGIPKVNAYYYDNETSETAKDQIDKEIRYYLVSTTQPEIRAEVDGKKVNLLYTVERKMINDQEVYDIMINIDGAKPQPLHRVYYRFDRPYQLQEEVTLNE